MLLYTMVQLHLLSSGAQKPLLAGALPAAVPDAGRGRTDLSWLWALMLWLTVQRQRRAVLVRSGRASGRGGAFGGKFGAPPQVGWLGLSCERLSLSSMSLPCIYIIEKGREGLENIKYMGNAREECLCFLPPPPPFGRVGSSQGRSQGIGGTPKGTG